MHTEKQPITIKRMIEFVIFNIKWLLIPAYFKLAYILAVFVYKFILGTINNESLTNVLEAVDLVMAVNLVKMIITGSYNSFISKTHGYTGENMSSGTLKLKMSTSLIGVTGIHLLKTFLEEGPVDWPVLQKQIAIHIVFVISGLALGAINWMHTKTETLEEDMDMKQEEHKSKLKHDSYQG